MPVYNDVLSAMSWNFDYSYSNLKRIIYQELFGDDHSLSDISDAVDLMIQKGIARRSESDKDKFRLTFEGYKFRLRFGGPDCNLDGIVDLESKTI